LTPEKYRIGIDTGGTFTDGVLINETTGEIQITKVPSTPDDPSRGFLNAAARLLKEASVEPEQVGYVVHGTTVATNAIIEGNVARTGFITTKGFRDMLEIARQIRPSLYDLQFEKPAPLVPRYLCFGVPERLNALGEVITPLDEDAVRTVALKLKEEGVEAIAVCLLHSYANQDHERRIGKILNEVMPEVAISLSSDIVPEFREYFRASTAVVNSSITPIVGQYLSSIEERLRADGLESELLVMQSNGGVYTFEAAVERPVYMVESGPAAGVIAASYVADAIGYSNVLSFDMGGTTTKAALIQDGEPKVTKDYEVGAAAGADTGAGRGSGYPIRTPVIDLVEIGAGGGSIAWVDPGGVLRVGPRSAGADPGPACYGQGGTEPTITDANLVLGRLNPDYFLGGEVPLHKNLAEKAIMTRCAEPLGLTLLEAANGIVEIANSAMVNALRLISVQRGFDPRDFVLVGFGGAGPVHATKLAIDTDVPLTIIPMSPGITSALGLLVTDLKHENSRTRINRVSNSVPSEIETILDELETLGRDALVKEGVPESEMDFERHADVRYVGQSYELSVELAPGTITQVTLDGVTADYHVAHERAYGHNAPEEPVEFVNMQVTARGEIARPNLKEVTRGTGSDGAIKETRDVYFAESGGLVPTPVFDRYRLGEGDQIAGPAIVEEVDSTTVIHPGTSATIDVVGNLLIRND
jgi:N-methylhydantoinase A